MPLPESVAQRLGPLIARVDAEASEFLRGSATALAQRRYPPPLEPMQASLTAHDAEVAALRSEGLTRPLSTIKVERLAAGKIGKVPAELLERETKRKLRERRRRTRGRGAVAPALAPGSAAVVRCSTQLTCVLSSS